MRRTSQIRSGITAVGASIRSLCLGHALRRNPRSVGELTESGRQIVSTSAVESLASTRAADPETNFDRHSECERRALPRHHGAAQLSVRHQLDARVTIGFADVLPPVLRELEPIGQVNQQLALDLLRDRWSPLIDRGRFIDAGHVTSVPGHAGLSRSVLRARGRRACGSRTFPRSRGRRDS